MLLENGATIKLDVVEAFAKAVMNPENMNEDFTINWNFVDADMNLELGMFYGSDYLGECMETLADQYEGQ